MSYPSQVSSASPMQIERFTPVHTTKTPEPVTGGDGEKVEKKSPIPNHTSTSPDPSAPNRALYGPSGKPEISDVRQGSYNDCYAAAALGALAQQDPGKIQQAIKDNGDGTYTVTLYERDNGITNLGGLFGDRYKEVKVTVSDADLPSNGMSSSNGPKWPQVMEAAYAKQNGGYDKIGGPAGGNPTTVMEAATGKDATNYSPSDGVGRIEQALADGKPVTILTPENGSLDYSLVNWHGYTVTGISTDKDGKKYVELRNPWGMQDPPKIPLEQLEKNISGVQIGD